MRSHQLPHLDNVSYLRHSPISYVGVRGMCQRNLFLRNSLNLMGGTDSRLWGEACQSIRAMGTVRDLFLNMGQYKPATEVVNSLASLDNEWFDYEFSSVRHYSFRIYPEAVSRPTSAGIVLRKIGFTRKCDADALLRAKFSALEHALGMPQDDWVKWMRANPLIWSFASRPKLLKLDEAVDKIREGKPINRLVSLPDAFESVISYPFYHALMEMKTPGYSEVSIMIGINKYGKDWKRLGDSLLPFQFVLEGDWSRFDQTVPSEYIHLAFSLIMQKFEGLTDRDRRVFEYIEYNFIHSVYYLPDGGVIQKRCGIPSGSQWTSLIGSMVNRMVLTALCQKLVDQGAVINYRIVVYGDDHLIGLDFSPEYQRKLVDYAFRRRFLELWSRQALRYGLVVKPSSLKLCSQFTVGYSIPEYDAYGLQKIQQIGGTGGVRAARRIFRSSLPDAEYRQTHRWSYHFDGRPSFLHCYWNEDLWPIRTTNDVMTSLANPERPIRHLKDHVNRLVVCLVENWWNFHIRNKVFQLIYDCAYLRDAITPQGTLDYSKLYDIPWGWRPERDAPPIHPTSRMWYRRYDSGYPFFASNERKGRFTRYEDLQQRTWEAAVKLATKVWGSGRWFPVYVREHIVSRAYDDDLLRRVRPYSKSSYSNILAISSIGGLYRGENEPLVRRYAEPNLFKVFNSLYRLHHIRGYVVVDKNGDPVVEVASDWRKQLATQYVSNDDGGWGPFALEEDILRKVTTLEYISDLAPVFTDSIKRALASASSAMEESTLPCGELFSFSVLSAIAAGTASSRLVRAGSAKAQGVTHNDVKLLKCLYRPSSIIDDVIEGRRHRTYVLTSKRDPNAIGEQLMTLPYKVKRTGAMHVWSSAKRRVSPPGHTWFHQPKLEPTPLDLYNRYREESDSESYSSSQTDEPECGLS